MTKLYENINLLRNERHVSWQKLREDTGIPISTMSEWKKEGSSPTLDNLKILANYFDVSIDFLIGRSNNRQGHKNNLRDTTLRIMQVADEANLDDKSTEIVIKLIRAFIE